MMTITYIYGIILFMKQYFRKAVITYGKDYFKIWFCI